MKLLILNGPNLNLLGLREPEIYGTLCYTDLQAHIQNICKSCKIAFEIFQSNHEGDLVDKIQEAYGKFDGIVLNAAAYSHTSIAILDALKAVNIPTVSVHLTEPKKREDFRKLDFPALYALKTFSGKGFESYTEAICYLSEYLQK